MKLKFNIIIILILIKFNSYSQNVTGVVYGSVFNYTMINESSHEFSFTTYFSMGGGNCPPFSSAITFSGNTMFVKATYNICGFWPAFGCVRNDVVPYTQSIPENIQFIIMSTNVISCETGDPTLVENVYTQTFDRNLSAASFSSNQVIMFPNPVKNVLTVTSADNVSFDTYTIFDLVGKKVLESNSNVINVEALSKGIYLLEMKSDTLKLARKFVKE